MKKIATSQFKKFKINLFVLLAVLAINSCTKDKEQFIVSSKAELISEAKKQFNEEQLLNDKLPSLAYTDNIRNSLAKTPLWEKADVKKISLGDAVIVPIKYEKDLFIKQPGDKEASSLAKLSYLMVYKDKKGKSQQELVTTIPNTQAKSKNGKFVGIIIIEDLNGKFKKGYAYNERGDIQPIRSSGSQIFRKASYYRGVNCYTFEVWGYAYWAGGESDMRLMSSETYCITTWGDATEEEAEPNPYGEGGGGGSTGGGDYNNNIDCAGVVNGSAYPSDCGCIGGTTGVIACDIRHMFEDYPCAKDLVDGMTNLNSSIATLIKNTFGRTDKLDLLFKPDPTLAGTSTDGKFNGYNSYISEGDKYETYIVGINPDVLNKASKEYILVTLYHEALHAYLAKKKDELGPEEFSNQFQGLTVNGGRLLGVQNEDHWDIGYGIYVIGLRDAILAFNPAFGTTRAIALAESGIMVLTPAKDLINDQERDTTSPGYTGTKCP